MAPKTDKAKTAPKVTIADETGGSVSAEQPSEAKAGEPAAADDPETPAPPAEPDPELWVPREIYSEACQNIEDLNHDADRLFADHDSQLEAADKEISRLRALLAGSAPEDSAGKVAALRVTARPEKGFWRAKRRWGPEPQEVKLSDLTLSQIKQLKDEPRLVIVECLVKAD